MGVTADFGRKARDTGIPKPETKVLCAPSGVIL